ncbi:MAG: monovalent cation/H(+) antiporter subunit G [Halobacteria archaeon]|nr:monovalent cation/H(+) antiporter subunit G [Halobacteria archaeon]
MKMILLTQTASTTVPVYVTVVSALLVVVGLFFLFTGTFGLLRLPDVYNRMHATSKSATLGASSIFLANFVYFGFSHSSAGFRALLGILFLFLTAPTGAHMISRSAHRMGVEFFGDAEWPREEGESETEDE